MFLPHPPPPPPLALGPYCCAYSHNGRSLLLGGHKGHVALLDWRRLKIITELQVRSAGRQAGSQVPSRAGGHGDKWQAGESADRHAG